MFILVIAILFAINCQSQSTIIETHSIETNVLNYIENFFENNYDEISKSLHPRLAKRGLNPDDTLSEGFPIEELKRLISTKEKLPIKYQKNVVEDITIYGNMARTSLKTGYPKTRWTEYIHLVKQEEKWKIINVFWVFKKK